MIPATMTEAIQAVAAIQRWLKGAHDTDLEPFQVLALIAAFTSNRTVMITPYTGATADIRVYTERRSMPILFGIKDGLDFSSEESGYLADMAGAANGGGWPYISSVTSEAFKKNFLPYAKVP